MKQLIIGLLITTLTPILSLFDKWKNKEDKNYMKNNTIAIMLFVIGVCGAAITFFAGIDAMNAKRMADVFATQKESKIDSQSKTIYSLELLNNDLIKRNVLYSKSLDSSSFQNLLLVKKVDSETIALHDFALGKGSFCYLDFTTRVPNTNQYHFGLFSSGTNPMDNVVARIVDVYNLEKDPYGVVLHIGTVWPKIHTVKMFETSYAPIKKDSIWINIFFQTAAREFVEELKKRYINNKWITSIKVFDEKEKLMFSKVEKGFPEK
jgi:hypothetical protein